VIADSGLYISSGVLLAILVVVVVLALLFR
jgi:hypothetical protein